MIDILTVSCDLLSEFLTLHQQQQRISFIIHLIYCCDLLSEFLTLHQQQQLLTIQGRSEVSCDLLSEFLTLHQQQQPFLPFPSSPPVVICFQNF